MAVHARVAYLRGLASHGTAMSIHISNQAQLGQCKVKVLVHATILPKQHLSVGTRGIVDTLNWLHGYIDQLVVTDRGHKHSGGMTECCFWIKQPSAGTANSRGQHAAPGPASAGIPEFGEAGSSSIASHIDETRRFPA